MRGRVQESVPRSGVRISNLFITLTSILSRTRERRKLPPMRAGGVVERTWITGKHIIMSAAQFIHELEAMSKSERESIFASLVENREWREDLFDLMTIADRHNEPVRPIDEVFSDLKIDA